MPPLTIGTKEKTQGLSNNTYHRPKLATFEFFGSQFEWAQAQQLHSNTVETGWQNMTSNKFGSNTNDYDDNEKPSLKQVSDAILMVATSLENPSRKDDRRSATTKQNDNMVQPPEQREALPMFKLQCFVTNSSNQFNNTNNNSNKSNNINNNNKFNSTNNINNNKFNSTNNITNNKFNSTNINNNKFNCTNNNNNNKFNNTNNTNNTSNNSQFGITNNNGQGQTNNNINNNRNSNRSNILSESIRNDVIANHARNCLPNYARSANLSIHTARTSVVPNDSVHGSASDIIRSNVLANHAPRNSNFPNHNSRSSVLTSNSARSGIFSNPNSSAAHNGTFSNSNNSARSNVTANNNIRNNVTTNTTNNIRSGTNKVNSNVRSGTVINNNNNRGNVPTNTNNNNRTSVLNNTNNIRASTNSNVRNDVIGVRSSAIGSNDVRSGGISSNNVRSSVIGSSNNVRSSVIGSSNNVRSSVIGSSNNVRSGSIGSNNVRGAIGSNNVRSSATGSNSVRSSVTGSNNVRSSATGSNNVRSSATGSNNVRSSATGSNNVRSSVTASVHNSAIINKNGQGQFNNTNNSGQTSNSLVGHNSSQDSNSIITQNSSQASNSFVGHKSSQVNNINNSSQISNGIVTPNSSQASNSIVTQNSSKASNGFVGHNSSNSIVTKNSSQTSNSFFDHNSSQVSKIANNSNQINNSTVTNNSSKVNKIVNSSQVSDSTATNNSSNQVSNDNNNRTDSMKQSDVSTVNPSTNGRIRIRESGSHGRLRIRKGKGPDQGQSRAIIIKTKDVREHPVEEEGNESKRRKITSEDNVDGTEMNVDGDGEVASIEDPNVNNMTETVTEPLPNTKIRARSKSRSSRSRARKRKDNKSPAARKSRGKRGRPNVASGTARAEDTRSDQDEQLESTSEEPLVATVPEPEPEPKSTIRLRKYLETLRLNELILNRDRLLRLGTFMLDYFVSQAWCRPFVNPEDESAVIYRLIITRLMDLTTVEHNLWAGEYDGAISKFYDDLAQILYNAFKFHPAGSIIFNEANLMLASFVEITTKFSNPPHDLKKLDVMLAQVGAKLPHEEFSDVCGVTPNPESRIYIVPLYSFRQVSRSGSNIAKLPQAAAERLDPMSRPLFDIFERRNLPPVRFQQMESHCNFARLYITMGAQNIKNCRDERNAILLIVKDVSYSRGDSQLRCNVIISKPFGELRELDTIGFPELQDARYWTRVAFLDKVTLDLKVGPKFFDKYLRTPFKVSEYDREIITTQQHEAFLEALNLRRVNSSQEGLSIWQRLVVEANRAKVPIESFESLGKPIQVDAEGFFKRVFHVPGDDKYVVQNFKEITESTLETRIREAVCCLKTKGISNTGQIRSVYKDEDDDELVGLSMERYDYTLKEYAFNTRAPITGEQKYRLIHDMVKGIKALHDAGFAHRDLSEVNMMVNSTTEKLADGSIKPELVVIDFGKAEFINRDDVLAWSVGEVANDKLEHLPWIKTVPDHGYKLYRSAATLPRTKNDHAVLQQPIDPCSEDIYAVGVLAWRIFSGQAPWGGILDTDLKNLREIVTDSIKIRFHIEKNVSGKKSRELLLKCITAVSQDRSTARELLDWLTQFKDELISEWATSGRVRIRKQL